MFTRMCEELELEASLKLHLHRKENGKLKFNNRRILKGVNTYTAHGPWRPHTHSTWTMETTYSLYMDHGDHTSTTHGPCMNTHPLHSDHVWIHTHATQTIQELTPTPYRSCISASPKTSLSNTSLKSKDVLSTCTLAASWDEGKQRTFVRYGHSIWLQPSCFMLCYFFKRISYQLKKKGGGKEF